MNLKFAMTIRKNITIHHVARARKLSFYNATPLFIVLCYQIPNAVNIISCIFHKCLFFSCTITIMLDKAIKSSLDNCNIALFISLSSVDSIQSVINLAETMIL